MPIRARILLGIALPAIVLLAAFSSLVYALVRRDRLDDLDATLRSRAAALAALVERDNAGIWESEPLAPIAGGHPFEVRAWREGPIIGGDGTLTPAPLEPAQVQWPLFDNEPRPILVIGRATDAGGARTFTGFFLVRAETPRVDDDEDAGAPGTSEAPLVRVAVSSELAPLEADLRALLATLAGAGAVLAALALVAGWLLSSRIVAPLAAMARDAEAVREPSATRPLTVRAAGGDEIDRLARAFNSAFARVYQAFERQRRFAADASHELRTPLAVVRTSAEVMLRAPRSPAEYREAFGAVLDGAKRMQRTVEGLLLLARADRGALEAMMESVDLAEVATGVVGALCAPRVPVAVNVAATVGSVRGNPDHLHVLVSNLIDNAVRHARSRVAVDVTRAGADIVLMVRDDGDGIPEHARELVFERFFRVDAARSTVHGGAGLGLSIVRAITDLHGGRVSVEQVDGAAGYTALVVTLPMVD